MIEKNEQITRTIALYHRDGRLFKYEIVGDTLDFVASKVTEHIQRICDTGYYRHNDGIEYELIPVILDGNRGIYKIKSSAIPTNYPDRTERT